MRRVVITGLGLLTPLACGVEPSWARLLEGRSGAGPITHFKVDDLPSRIACEVPLGDGSDHSFNADQWVASKEQRRADDFIIYGLVAAQQAVTDSGYEPKTEEEHERAGVLLGSGIGGLGGIEAASILVHEEGPRKLSPFFIPGRLVNLASGYVSMRFGYKGPNHAVATACSTGTHAIGDAARLIALDDADVMLAGGTENAICRIGMAGFAACRALSTGFNDTPTKASRPYDKDRDGFVNEVVSIDPSNGKVLWTYDGLYSFATIASPKVIDQTRLFLTCGSYNGNYRPISIMLDIRRKNDKFQITEVFKTEEAGSKIHAAVRHGRYLYLNSGDRGEQMTCMSIDGEIMWTGPSFHLAGPILIGDLILNQNGKTGDVFLIQATPKKYTQLGHAQLKTPKNKTPWAPLAYSKGKLLVRHSQSLICLDLMNVN